MISSTSHYSESLDYHTADIIDKSPCIVKPSRTTTRVNNFVDGSTALKPLTMMQEGLLSFYQIDYNGHWLMCCSRGHGQREPHGVVRPRTSLS